MESKVTLFAERYQILGTPKHWISRPGSEVLLALDKHNNDKPVVIKKVNPRDRDSAVPTTIEYILKKEAQILSRLRVQAVPSLIEARYTTYRGDRCYFFTIDYAKGRKLEENLHSLSIPDRLKLLHQLTDLLIYAHYTSGVSNGEIAPKHICWDHHTQSITVIDWGNGRFEYTDYRDFCIDYLGLVEVIELLLVNETVRKSGLQSGSAEVILLAKGVQIPNKIYEVLNWKNVQKKTGGFHFDWSLHDLSWSLKVLHDSVQAYCG